MIEVVSILVTLFLLSVLISVNFIVKYNRKYNETISRLDRYVDHYNEHLKKYNQLVEIVTNMINSETNCKVEKFENLSLEELLKKAIKEEDYEEAARIQNIINGK